MGIVGRTNPWCKRVKPPPLPCKHVSETKGRGFNGSRVAVNTSLLRMRDTQYAVRNRRRVLSYPAGISAGKGDRESRDARDVSVYVCIGCIGCNACGVRASANSAPNERFVTRCYAARARVCTHHPGPWTFAFVITFRGTCSRFRANDKSLSARMTDIGTTTRAR